MVVVVSLVVLFIGWGIIGVGILLLVFVMLIFMCICFEFDGGIFIYVCEGFGELIGFCFVWGYWLCVVIVNVFYLVIVFFVLSFFMDMLELCLFGDGNIW